LPENYFGYPLGDYCTFDTELVSKIIFDLKCGKATDINGLTAEHLSRHYGGGCRVSIHLCILFNMFIEIGVVPVIYEFSVAVLLVNNKDGNLL